VAGPAAAAELAALWREQVGRPRLSPVEQQLLPLLADWQLTYGAIGARLGIAPATVKGRVRRLAATLGVTGGRLAVVEAARRQGLLPR
ncbi:MAG: DNA-binding response regulator, partial [Dehalococcoidia bacterium]|nr:DNA-binding response regulator [Dehalococcoidia bacterium]